MFVQIANFRYNGCFTHEIRLDELSFFLKSCHFRNKEILHIMTTESVNIIKMIR